MFTPSFPLASVFTPAVKPQPLRISYVSKISSSRVQHLEWTNWCNPKGPCRSRLPHARLALPRAQVFSQIVIDRAGLNREEDKSKDVLGAQQKSRNAVDYSCCNEDGVLALPLNQELDEQQLRNVFGYPRHLTKLYDIKEMLGAGSFGLVYKAVEMSTGREYAIKTVPKKPKKGKATPRYLLKLQTEVEAMDQLGASLNAVFLKDVFEDNLFVHLVMELCTGGALLDHWDKADLSEQDVARHVRSILRFLAQCHAKGVIYRDVKADNFLFLNDSHDSPLKATDFGLAIRHWPQEGNLKSRSGTPAYMAPEVIMQDYNEKCDLWSTGMLMYQMLTGQFPFWDNLRSKKLQEIWKSILVDRLDFNSPELKRTCSPQARDLLRKLLERDPIKRISAADALDHPWIKELDDHPECPLCGTVVQRVQRYATYGRLKQTVLKTVAHEIIEGGTLKSLRELQDLFKTIDVDSSGMISFDELKVGLRQQGYTISDDEVDQLMGRMDMDGDGSLDFEELATALLDWDDLHCSEMFGEALDKVFAKLDTNNKGYLDYTDLMVLLPADLQGADQQTREAEARKMMREIDPTHQGQLGKPEFIGILMESYAEDALQQYDDRLHHEASISGSM